MFTSWEAEKSYVDCLNTLFSSCFPSQPHCMECTSLLKGLRTSGGGAQINTVYANNMPWIWCLWIHFSPRLHDDLLKLSSEVCEALFWENCLLIIVADLLYFFGKSTKLSQGYFKSSLSSNAYISFCSASWNINTCVHGFFSTFLAKVYSIMLEKKTLFSRWNTLLSVSWQQGESIRVSKEMWSSFTDRHPER